MGGLQALSEFDYKSVIILFLICTIGLGTFYTYKRIQSFEFIMENKTISPRDKYFEEFGLESLKNDLAIRDILTETRLVTRATAVALWGYHNGISVGPFPFKKMSILDESVGAGDARLARRYQDIPLNLFIDHTIDVWESPNTFSTLELERAREDFPNVYYYFTENGFRYGFFYPIHIKGFASPVGLFAIYLSKEDIQRVIGSETNRLAFEQYGLEQAQRVELLFNSQYLRIQE